MAISVQPPVSQMDFSATVRRLESRARLCRFYSLGIFSVLVIIVVTAISFITFNLLERPQTLKESLKAEMTGDVPPILKQMVDLNMQGEIQQIIEKTPTWVEILVSSVFSFGVFGVFLYLMQISVSFIRYYSFAAEHYDTQADALRAASGDPGVAYAFIQHFGPPAQNVRIPATLHEKMLATISDVANSRLRAAANGD